MDKIEKLIWKKIDGTLNSQELQFLESLKEDTAYLSAYRKIRGLHQGLKEHASLSAPTSLVSRIMKKVEHISIIPDINYNRILLLSVLGIMVLTIPVLYFLNDLPSAQEGYYVSVDNFINSLSYNLTELSILPYLMIIPCITFLIWMDQSFSRRRKV